jgi:hypothetical protein
MSIGLSRNAEVLLTQLVDAYHQGEAAGLTGDQLSFTLSTDQGQTTIQFAAGDLTLEINDANALLVLRVNGFIEEFTTIERTSNVPRYVVTQTGMTAVARSTV